MQARPAAAHPARRAPGGATPQRQPIRVGRPANDNMPNRSHAVVARLIVAMAAAVGLVVWLIFAIAQG